MTPFETLMAYEKTTEALNQVAGRLGWDQETMMPEGAADQRAEEAAALEAVLYARRTSSERGAMIAAVEDDALDTVGAAQMRHISRSYARSTALPERLTTELARLTSRAQRIWAGARAEEDVAAFLPTLTQVIALKREEAAHYAQGGNVYDALLDDYEPGATGAGLAALFDEMRPRLSALRAAVLERETPAPLTGHFDTEGQMALAHKLARAFGYDFNHGRLDLAVHPFSSGSGLDARITTRVVESDPFNCWYSTIHEAGHACYELGIDPAYLLTPLGGGVSMGVHESQSRIYENQLGRSRAFCGWFYEAAKAQFGDLGVESPDGFYAAANAVKRGYIRTEADEVQYNLHVMLRFDLERALMTGDLTPGDLEAAWNDRFEADFGYPVDKPSNGLLQDVHWSVGLFGYFPTYSLGNVYAGCLNNALRAAVPDLDAQLEKGDTSAATGWLRASVQTHGGLKRPRKVIEEATGAPVTAEPLLAYLEEKFGALYDL